ncbi:cytospin-A-like [Centruroides sculpturatus]|uniref:cytospin-A-like n=1 Tax=Centruroides sculpturatus TaxID=218467 RepID=UPI000C6D7BBA|nr:cytospin-A-like [Centruroides sculpturatus]
MDPNCSKRRTDEKEKPRRGTVENQLENWEHQGEGVEQMREELEALQEENLSLKERLVEMGVGLPVEQAALSDTEKEQLLLRKSGSITSLDTEKKDTDEINPLSNESLNEKLPNLEMGEASGVSLPRPLSEWDKASSSSLSEMSMACLQDRIMQMEETHYSTNEELQATLQELTDLQDQLTDLQLENERMSDEKAVLLESLCSQTEKLEECRTQITQLKQLLFQQYEEGGDVVSNASEREHHLVDLLKNSHEEREMLLMKQEELSSTIQAAKEEAMGYQTELVMLRDRVRLLESTVESINADKKLLDRQNIENQEQLSANQIEVSQLKLQLENEQQKVSELQREREANATSELDNLLSEARRDKEKIEAKAMRLQEQLALSQRETSRLKEKLNQIQEENMVTKNNAHKQLSDLEYRIEQLETEKLQIQRDMEILEDALHQAELKCQRHLEDKRELKATVGELQKTVNETTSQLKEVQKELDEFKEKHCTEIQEWQRFQADLLTTVRVANDFKTEAQQDVERLAVENKQLKEKIESLESEYEKLKVKKELLSSSHQRNISLRNTNIINPPDVSVLTSVEKDLVSTRRQLNSTKWGEHRGATQMSVKSLIESIENATKHAKGPSSSHSSSTSSVGSTSSETRTTTNSILLGSGSNIFIKPPLRSASSDASLLRDTKTSSQSGRLQRNSYNEGKSNGIASTLTSEPVSGLKTNGEIETSKPPPAHPVSILASKLEPMRRNSYGDVEKKDPLSSLVKGGGSKRNALLKWCQNKTMGYKGIDITNFSSSWNDGLAFCALLHSYLPDLIPYNELDGKDKRRNFTIAFQAAESVGISTTLNINELISQERPDWQSIMTYVTSLYKHFET